MKTLKRTLIPILSAAMLLTATIPASAVNTHEAPIKVTVDGTAVDFPDQTPIIQNDRTLVPIRFIAESLGYDVEWDSIENAAIIDDGRVKLWIGTDKAELNGELVTLDTSSVLVNDRTMVPLRAVAETLDCTVDWLAKTKTVQITSGTETSVWDRLSASGIFPMESDESAAWFVKQNVNTMKYCGDHYDCEIYVRRFDEKTLSEIREALMVIYPTGYDTVYELMLKSIKAELWECLRENAGYLASGTFGAHYIDGREVSIYVQYGLSYMTIGINKPGYVNPEKPMELSDSQISDLTTEAKKFYPLERYGLN